MSTLARALKVFGIVFFLLYVSSLFSPFGRIRVDMVGLVLVYVAWRKHGGTACLWLVAVLAYVRFGLEDPALEWPPLAITYASALLFKWVFKRIYVESYAIEVFHVLLVLSLSLLLQHVFFRFMSPNPHFFGEWLLWRLAHLIPTTAVAFTLFIGLDKVEKLLPDAPASGSL